MHTIRFTFALFFIIQVAKNVYFMNYFIDKMIDIDIYICMKRETTR